MRSDDAVEVTALAINVTVPEGLRWTDTRRGAEFLLSTLNVRLLPDGHLAAKAYGRPTAGGRGTYVSFPVPDRPELAALVADAGRRAGEVWTAPRPRPTDEFRRPDRSTRTYPPRYPPGDLVTVPAHPGRMLFVSLPVADVDRSTAFFVKLGFTFDPNFSSEAGACMLVGEQASVMLVSHAMFGELSKLPMGDPTTHALALYCFSVPSREEVDTVADAALAAGAREADGLEDHGFMCSRSFFDLDGHGWQVMWMDPAAAQQGPEAFASMEDAGAQA